MGGKSKPDNSAVVQEQQQEAAQEAAKEAARQQRIQQGLTSIKQAFEGSPVMGTKTQNFDWSTFKPQLDPNAVIGSSDLFTGTNLPAGYTAVREPVKTSAAGAGSPSSPVTIRTGGGASASGLSQVGGGSGSAGGGGTGWAVKGPDGKIYNQGDPLSYDTQYDTGQTSGGFDDAFYDKYKQAVLDYYQPQVDKQYSDAKKQAVYGLGRSGNLISSAANDLNADLATQNAVNVAGVRNQADTAAGDLRSQVNTEEQKATSQLYATEDPEVAAQQSLASVRDINNTTPQMSPLSALFNVATIGGANILKGYQGQQNLNAFNSSLPVASRSSKIVPTG